MIKHGAAVGCKVTPEYTSWRMMCGRCCDRHHHDYPRYGAVGVTVHPEWCGPGGFIKFLAHVGLRPNPTYSIDRYPDPFGNYEPGNVRWASAEEQARNLTSNRQLTYNGITRTMAEWADITGIAADLIGTRLSRGWSTERALTEPVRSNFSHAGINGHTYKHGGKIGNRATPEYTAWRRIKDACYNKNSPHYAKYGARGIIIAPEWLNNFKAFLDYIGPRPGHGYSVDRYPSQNGNYEPGNVRWATITQQNRNLSTNQYIEYDGVIKTVAEWADITGILIVTIKWRLRHGWSVERALTTKT